MNSDLKVTQHGFDPLGPTVRTTVVVSGRTIHYVDEGDPSWLTLVFFGGAGTSVRAFGLLEFARGLREQLNVRVISAERNGLGQTPFDPAVGYAEYGADVWALLDQLGVRDASLIAISGGGPYAVHVAAAQPDRVRSLHLACAFSERLSEDEMSLSVAEIANDPVAWWRYPPDSPVHHIPGFVDSTIEEATREYFARGRTVAPDGLAHAFQLYRNQPLPDLSSVTAPAFLYWGETDTLVPTAHLDRWQQRLPTVRETRIYAAEGHDVQYRHWDQILTDVAYLGERVIICADGATMLVPHAKTKELLGRGATYGLCAWRNTT